MLSFQKKKIHFCYLCSVFFLSIGISLNDQVDTSLILPFVQVCFFINLSLYRSWIKNSELGIRTIKIFVYKLLNLRTQMLVQDILDAIEFALGDSNSKWGSVRAAMGHTEPFDLRYVAVGNQDCGNKNYRGT